MCACGAPLLCRYDLDRAAQLANPETISSRKPSLWKYHELLPVRDAAQVVSFDEGMTPLIRLDRIGGDLAISDLWLKDEGVLVTGTFKARGAAVGVSRAKEFGVTGVAMPTNGNAGAAWSAYAARGGLQSLIAMPRGAPAITVAECEMTGAELHLVDGHIGDAAAFIREQLATRDGYQDVSTLKEPYRLEGKKTMGYEIAEQLGWRFPDVVIYPAGGGVGIIGIHKAFRELLELGWVAGDLPRLVCVQAEGCAPIVRAFESGDEVTSPVDDPVTVAFGITVPNPLGGFLVLRAVRESIGTAVAVSDDDLLTAQRELARSEGLFICPEGAACMAALRILREQGWLHETDEVVVLNTGTGIKYPETAPSAVAASAEVGLSLHEHC